MARRQKPPQFFLAFLTEVQKNDCVTSENPTIEGLKQQVSELKLLVETISRGKFQWEATFDVISDPVVIIDENYHIIRANMAMAQSCRTDVKDVIGKSCYKLFAGYDAPCPKCPVILTLADRKPHNVELDPFPKGHRQYFTNVYIMPQQSHNLGRAEVVLHYRDMTGEKNLQRQLVQTDKMAAIGTLAGGIAHEINNPLAAILAHVQLASVELEKEHACQDSLREIEESVLRCTKIVRDLLDFSRQNFDEQMQPILLNEVVQKTMNLIHVDARHSHIHIEQNLAEQLPLVFGHFHKLEQVVLNLVTNSMHAIREAGGTLSITTAPSSDGRHVVLMVTDTGYGIDEDVLNKIFDPFFTTKEQGEGTGLGLSISYNIIKEHDGMIEVESLKDKGSLFRVILPVYHK